MNKETDLFSLASAIERASFQLEEIDTLIGILEDKIDIGCRNGGEIEPWIAIHYVRQIPVRLALLHAIQRDLTLQIRELTEASNQLMGMWRCAEQAGQKATTHKQTS